jgi:hypothetical protein
VCGKRGFPPGVSAIGNWSGDKIWHSTCDDTNARPASPQLQRRNDEPHL